MRACRAERKPVPGFGHPVHQAHDPRVPRLLQIVRDADTGGEFLAALELVETSVREELGKPLVTNISAAIGAALGEAGVPAMMMRGVVLTARCAGLVGHLLEEMDNPAGSALWEAAQASVGYRP